MKIQIMNEHAWKASNMVYSHIIPSMTPHILHKNCVQAFDVEQVDTGTYLPLTLSVRT